MSGWRRNSDGIPLRKKTRPGPNSTTLASRKEISRILASPITLIVQ